YAWTRHLADNGGFGGNLYTLVTWTRAASDAETTTLVFERNNRFWGKKPALRRLEYRLYSATPIGPHGDWKDLSAGAADIFYPRAATLDEAHRPEGTVFQQAPYLEGYYLQIDQTRAPFDDDRIRHAFSLAIDRAAIADGMVTYVVQPSTHFIPE